MLFNKKQNCAIHLKEVIYYQKQNCNKGSIHKLVMWMRSLWVEVLFEKLICMVLISSKEAPKIVDKVKLLMVVSQNLRIKYCLIQWVKIGEKYGGNYNVLFTKIKLIMWIHWSIVFGQKSDNNSALSYLNSFSLL